MATFGEGEDWRLNSMSIDWYNFASCCILWHIVAWSVLYYTTMVSKGVNVTVVDITPESLTLLHLFTWLNLVPISLHRKDCRFVKPRADISLPEIQLSFSVRRLLWASNVTYTICEVSVWLLLGCWRLAVCVRNIMLSCLLYFISNL